jgi:hypothetical protein
MEPVESLQTALEQERRERRMELAQYQEDMWKVTTAICGSCPTNLLVDRFLTTPEQVASNSAQLTNFLRRVLEEHKLKKQPKKQEIPKDLPFPLVEFDVRLGEGSHGVVTKGFLSQNALR